ncbi:hypothetical protein MIR68_009891 [Amoeboaphelidium protococcarum]|nr:hypothetical protein MIR68_009891 [Amoeboaphelidium protococcarum]
MQLIKSLLLCATVALVSVSAYLPVLKCPTIGHIGEPTFKQETTSGSVCVYKEGSSCNLSPAASFCVISGVQKKATVDAHGNVSISY